MKKKLLFLTAWLLTAANAETWAQRVDVDPENIQSYAELKQVVANIDDAPKLKKAYTDAVAYEEKLKGEEPAKTIDIEKKETVTETNLLLTHMVGFVTSVGNFNNGSDAEVTPNKLSYRIRAIKSKGEPVSFYLYVTIPDWVEAVDANLAGQDKTGTNVFNKWADSEWTEIDMNEIKKMLTDDDADFGYSLKRSESDVQNAAPIQMRIYYKKAELIDGNITYSDAFISKSPVGTVTSYFINTGWVNAMQEIIDQQSYYGFEVTYEKTTILKNQDNPGYPIWETDYSNAQAATVTAKANWEAIKNGDFYLDSKNAFKITGNFEVPADRDENLIWPDRTLDGGCCMITGNVPVFDENKGTIRDIITPEGRFVDTNSKRLRDCIFKQSDTEWRIYDNDGYTFYTTIESAVYKMRDKFGYDIKKNVATGAATRTTKLYEAKYTDAMHKDLYTFHVNLGENDDENAFVYNEDQAKLDNRLATGIKRENTVIYIDNTDVPDDVKAWPNVAVRNSVGSEKYTCKNVKLVDGVRTVDGKEVETEEFYIHTGFAFETMKYERSFAQDMTAVCLPFKLDANAKAALQEKTGTNIWYYTFKEVNGKTIWFNVVDEIAANTPCIIAYDGMPKNEDVFNDFTFTVVAGENELLPEIASTNGATLGAVASNSGELCFFGNYKAGQHANELSAINNGGKGACIYGFQNGELRLMPEATKGEDGKLHGSRLHQFRSYIRLEADLTGNTAAPNSFNIGFLDEDGNEVTGIGTVESGKNDSGVKAMGGNGVIELTAEKACEVKVYTASGSLVKAIRVEAGNTTLPFSAGVYVVNQTKVVVK